MAKQKKPTAAQQYGEKYRDKYIFTDESTGDQSYLQTGQTSAQQAGEEYRKRVNEQVAFDNQTRTDWSRFTSSKSRALDRISSQYQNRTPGWRDPKELTYESDVNIGEINNLIGEAREIGKRDPENRDLQIEVETEIKRLKGIRDAIFEDALEVPKYSTQESYDKAQRAAEVMVMDDSPEAVEAARKKAGKADAARISENALKGMPEDLRDTLLNTPGGMDALEKAVGRVNESNLGQQDESSELAELNKNLNMRWQVEKEEAAEKAKADERERYHENPQQLDQAISTLERNLERMMERYEGRQRIRQDSYGRDTGDYNVSMSQDGKTIQGINEELLRLRTLRYELKNTRAYEGYMALSESDDFEALSRAGAALPEDQTPYEKVQEWAGRFDGVVGSGRRYIKGITGEDPGDDWIYDAYQRITGVDVTPDEEQEYDKRYLDETEQGVYNYLRAKDAAEGTQEAEAFLKASLMSRQQRETEALMEVNRDIASQNKALGAIAAAFTGNMSAQSYLAPFVNKIENSQSDEFVPLSEYDPLYGAVHAKAGYMQGLTENMDEVGQFLTSVGVSMAEFLMMMPLSGAGKVGKIASLTNIGLKSAGATAADVTARGGTTDQAISAGMLAGAAEIFFERIGIERILSIKDAGRQGVKGLLAGVYNGFVSEGAEELGTEVVNTLTDWLVMGGLSNVEVTYDTYLREGMTPEAARLQTIKDMSREFGLAFAGGALSGAVMDGGMTTINMTRNWSQDRAGRRAETRAKQKAHLQGEVDTDAGAEVVRTGNVGVQESIRQEMNLRDDSRVVTVEPVPTEGVVPYTGKEANRHRLNERHKVAGVDYTAEEFAAKYYDPETGGTRKGSRDNERLFIGKLPGDVADLIKNDLQGTQWSNRDIENYNVVLRSDNILHAYSRHGRETIQGQIDVTPEHMGRFGDVVANPDYVLSDGIPVDGNPAYLFVKRINGYAVAVSVVSSAKTKQFFPQTFYVMDSDTNNLQGLIKNKMKVERNGRIDGDKPSTLYVLNDPAQIQPSYDYIIPDDGRMNQALDENMVSPVEDARQVAESMPADLEGMVLEGGDPSDLTSYTDQMQGPTDREAGGLRRAYDDGMRDVANRRKGLENQLVQDFTQGLHMPQSAVDTITERVRMFADMAMKGEVDGGAIDAMYESLYDSIRMRNQWDDNAVEVRRGLVNTVLNVPKGLKGDFANWGEFARTDAKGLRMSETKGIPVDTAYMEFTDRFGEGYFPADVVHPAEQLRRIAQVAEETKQRYLTPTEAFGNAEQDFNVEMRRGYEQGAQELLTGIRELSREMERLDSDLRIGQEEAAWTLEDAGRTAGEDLAMREAGQFDPQVLEGPELVKYVRSIEDNLYRAQTAYDDIAKAVELTEKETKQAEHIRDGSMSESTLRTDVQDTVVFERIMQVARAGQQLDTAQRLVNQHRSHARASINQRAERLTRNVAEWKDTKTGITLEMDTAERNARTVAGNVDGEVLINEVFYPIHDNEADNNRYKNPLKQRIKDLKLTKREAELVTPIAEGTLDAFLDGNQNSKRPKAYTDENIRRAREAVPVFQEVYAELYQGIVETYARLGLELPGHIENYMPHYNDPDDLFYKALKGLGVHAPIGDLPTDIAGVTEVFRPNKKWNPNLETRRGRDYNVNALEAADRYIEAMSFGIHHAEDIMNLRALENQIRYQASSEAVRVEMDAIFSDPDLDYDTKNERIKQVQETMGDSIKLGNYATWLRTYTDIVAGKRYVGDRFLEKLLGRTPLYNGVKALESRVASNMVGANIASACTNAVSLMQGASTISPTNMARAVHDTMKNRILDDGFNSKSTFMTNRIGAENISLTNLQALDAFAGMMMDLTDTVTTEIITRGKYLDCLDNGMTAAEAMRFADQYTMDVFADRSLGSMPNIFHGKNPLVKAMTMFQLEVKNQWSFIYKDLPRYLQGEGAGKVLSVILKYLIGQWIYNDAYEWVFGRRPGPDLIGFVNETVGDITGYRMPNMIDLLLGNPEQSNTAEKLETKQLAASIIKRGAEEMPFIGGLLGGSRIPVASVFPDGAAQGDLTKLVDGDTWRDWFKNLQFFQMLPPTGGGQMRKWIRGFTDVSRGGKYYTTKDGEKLAVPIEQTAGNYFRAFLGGSSTIPEVQKYYREGTRALSVPQTEKYEALRGMGVDGKTAEVTIRGIGAIEGDKDVDGKTITKSKQENVRKFILAKVGLDDAQRDELYKMYFPKAESINDPVELTDKVGEQAEILDAAGLDYEAMKPVLGEIKEIGTTKDNKGKIVKTRRENVRLYVLQLPYDDKERQAIFEAAGMEGSFRKSYMKKPRKRTN